MTDQPMPTLHDVIAARPHVYRYLRPTPLYNYAGLSALLGADVWVKHENHQPVGAFKGKACSIHWESMFTRSSFQTADMIGQHHLLNDVADLIDKGVLRTTLDQTFGTINAANLKRAHALLESGKSRGKIVLEGW